MNVINTIRELIATLPLEAQPIGYAINEQLDALTSKSNGVAVRDLANLEVDADCWRYLMAHAHLPNDQRIREDDDRWEDVARYIRELVTDSAEPATFTFGGWGDSPLDLFNEQRWGECLHATLQAYNVIGDPDLTQEAIADTGLLHELAHLASGVPICTTNRIRAMRAELKRILELVEVTK